MYLLQAGSYCNGPLKPGGVYRFKIRAYTTQQQFSETHWSQPIQTDPDNTAFLVGIIIPIILLLLVALVVLGVRRMRNSNGGNGSSCLKRSLPGKGTYCYGYKIKLSKYCKATFKKVTNLICTSH